MTEEAILDRYNGPDGRTYVTTTTDTPPDGFRYVAKSRDGTYTWVEITDEAPSELPEPTPQNVGTRALAEHLTEHGLESLRKGLEADRSGDYAKPHVAWGRTFVFALAEHGALDEALEAADQPESYRDGIREAVHELAEHAGLDCSTMDPLPFVAAKVIQDWAERSDETNVPAHVIRDRYGDNGLSPMQSIAYYLCDDDEGPSLTQQAAGEALGMSRDQLWTHLSRARDKLQEA